MKKQFAALLTALSLLPTLALAQDYYTLPEIREQAKDGWHETYTDKYGRETVVDIDVEVYGGRELRQCSRSVGGKYGEIYGPINAFKLEQNHPIDRLMEAQTSEVDKSTYIYEWCKKHEGRFGTKNTEKNYGNDLTLTRSVSISQGRKVERAWNAEFMIIFMKCLKNSASYTASIPEKRMKFWFRLFTIVLL